MLHVDWRQIRRWKIDERSIPATAVVHFREPTLFEAYRLQVLVAAAVLALQAALIGLLLEERRRRRAAELSEQGRRTELAHASRLAVAGELLGSIAHEINQPLGAILSNADAAEMHPRYRRRTAGPSSPRSSPTSAATTCGPAK